MGLPEPMQLMYTCTAYTIMTDYHSLFLRNVGPFTRCKNSNCLY